jgi:UDP-N-acetylmuramate dehydrogenase
MNAGAYGGEIKDILVSATLLAPDGTVRTVGVEELDLSYRHSGIPETGEIVLGAEFALKKGETAAIRQTMAELRERRSEKQPLEFYSAGSTFKRPEGYFAGKLIMDAGLRGYSVGDAQVSEKHCGFVINRGDATAAQILQLIADVRAKVFAEFQVELEPEIRILGD